MKGIFKSKKKKKHTYTNCSQPDKTQRSRQPSEKQDFFFIRSNRGQKQVHEILKKKIC